MELDNSPIEPSTHGSLQVTEMQDSDFVQPHPTTSTRITETSSTHQHQDSPLPATERPQDHIIEILPSLLSNDLPIRPTGTLRPAPEYIWSLPVLRTLDWQKDSAGNPMRRRTDTLHSSLAAAVQTRGKVAEKQCNYCAAGNGPWGSCVVTPLNGDIGGYSLKASDGICANCRAMAQWNCSYRINVNDEDSEEDVTERFQSRARTLAWRGGKRGPAPRAQPARIARPLTLRESTPEQSHPHEAVPTVQETTVGPRSARRVVPFPLGREAFNDLPLLRRALGEQQRNVDIIQRRIKKLDKEERERSAANPWDIYM
ncbi:hypothetical protein BJX70DRAFT_400701 [Aspergillus crustosus]